MKTKETAGMARNPYVEGNKEVERKVLYTYEVAAMLGVTEETIQRLVREGKLKRLDFQKRPMLFTPGEVARFIKESQGG